jgi:hypothetical protein
VNRTRRWLKAGLLLAALLGAALPAQAALMDFLFGKKTEAEAKANPGQRVWRIGEYTAIRLVPREAGATPNAHPVQVQPELLRQQLALVRARLRSGDAPLFFADELAELIEPIAQALSVAGPDDDLVLLSTARRDGGVLGTPLGITARLFVQGNALNLLVHDARLDFVNAYIGSRIPPSFTFGSREQAGATTIQTVSGTGRRADWVALPLAAITAQASGIAPAPVAATVPAVPVVTPPAVAPGAVSGAVPAAPARARDATFADEIEQRLLTLKRLRDKGLISEEEYQQKRKEILQLL